MQEDFSQPPKLPPVREGLPKHIKTLYLIGAILFILAGSLALYTSVSGYNHLNKTLKDLGEDK